MLPILPDGTVGTCSSPDYCGLRWGELAAVARKPPLTCEN
ncbi:MAG: hypothetical protein QOI25_848, partial [Mycobacterium sp.]|nr:hypothetical protein [Mycobacterium sp.]